MLTGLLFDLTKTSIKNILLQTHLNQTIISLRPTSMFQSLTTPYMTVINIAKIDRPSFIAEHSSVSEFSSDEKASQFCESLRTVLDMHEPPSLWKVITHKSSP